MPSRDPRLLTSDTYNKFLAFQAKMKEKGIDFIVTCTIRTQSDQDELWAIGRTKPGRKVTWTRKSNHIKGTAFDICIMINGKPMWNPQLDEDKDGIPEYTEAGLIGESVGLKWGGRFMKTDKNGRRVPNPDAPHFENA